MAKQTKQAAPATETKEPAQKVEKGGGDKFTRLFDKSGKATTASKADGTAARVAPQMQAIANTLEAFGKDGTTRDKLVEALSAPGVLTTKQPVGRILSYYQKDLVSMGLATHAKA